MKTLLLAAGAAALALSASSALAGPGKNAGRTVAGPKQPIPYAELDSYLKASPKTRASKDWWSGGAESTAGAGANVSATTSGSSATTPKDATAPK